MKKVVLILLCLIISIIMILIAQMRYQQNTAINSTGDGSKDSISTIFISDNELIDIAMEISKEENNYTYWLFSHDNNVDNSDIVQVEINFFHNGEKFSSFYNYAPISEFESIEDFVNSASNYLSSQYIENYLYKLIGMHPTESIPAPILLELNGNLYKAISIDGVSIIPNIKYNYGEVIEKTDFSAIVRLYVDPSIDTDISFIDYPLILENNIWKHDPIY